MLEEAINKSFKLYFKEDPTGTSKILYHGIPVVPIDKSGNLDLSDFLTKIILAYAGI